MNVMGENLAQVIGQGSVIDPAPATDRESAIGHARETGWSTTARIAFRTGKSGKTIDRRAVARLTTRCATAAMTVDSGMATITGGGIHTRDGVSLPA